MVDLFVDCLKLSKRDRLIIEMQSVALECHNRVAQTSSSLLVKQGGWVVAKNLKSVKRRTRWIEIEDRLPR